MPISPARVAAFQILKRVETDGGYASDLIARASQLDSRDAGLTSQIVFGCLRYMAQLDYLALRYAGRKSLKLDVEVSIALRMGIFQIRHLDRIPVHAAVSESVELVKWSGKRSAAGLVNAILRKVNREPVKWPDRETALSCPEWLLTRWSREYGEDAAARNRAGGTRRTQGLHAWRPDAGHRIAIRGPMARIEGRRIVPRCVRGAEPSTAQAMETQGVRAVAGDLHMHRLVELRSLGCPLVQLDANKALPFREESFDKMLVDAPCSGTGTLGRNPEIKWRLSPDDLENLAVEQRAIHEERVRRAETGWAGGLLYVFARTAGKQGGGRSGFGAASGVSSGVAAEPATAGT